ncbi:arginase family protein [Archangium violaceum]|uniref:Agmatinase n=1 Tax=Archangium violaceum Cb vi76 TaxID=1406225 RepID=A0A084T007_9BACT|nr:arginase family protein [Archangium violaceum]KFA94042.1 hypothetical protein Q664_05220 [Archangium violaceum Cb vi76]
MTRTRRRDRADEGGEGFLGAAVGTGGDVVVIGVPFEQGSVQSAGCAQAPSTLRALTRGESISAGIWDYASRRRIIQGLSLSDAGDFEYRASIPRGTYFRTLEDFTSTLASEGRIPLGFGGDHSVTLPLARGVAKAHGRIQVVQLDAHHDYAPVARGRLPTHSNFVSFLARSPGIHRVVQLGVRGYSSWLPRRPRGVIDVPLADAADAIEPGLETYLTIDTDAFDPTLAPAVVHPMPGGLTWADLDQVLTLLARRRCAIVGLDWTEYNPTLEGRNFPTGIAIVHALIRVLGALDRARREGRR